MSRSPEPPADAAGPSPSAGEEQPPLPNPPAAPQGDPAYYRRRKKRNNEICQILIRQGSVAPEHVRMGLRIQEERGGQIGRILVQMGACTEKAVAQALIEQVRLRHAARQAPNVSTAARANPAIVGLNIECRPHWSTAALVVVDISVLATVALTAAAVNFVLSGGVSSDLIHYGFPILLFLPAFYGGVGLYSPIAPSPPDEIRLTTLTTTCVFALGAFLAVAFGAELRWFVHVSITFAWVLALLLVPTARALIRLSLSTKGWWGHPVVVLGAGKTGRLVVRALKQRPYIGLRPVVVLDDDRRKYGTLRASVSNEGIELNSIRDIPVNSIPKVGPYGRSSPERPSFRHMTSPSVQAMAQAPVPDMNQVAREISSSLDVARAAATFSGNAALALGDKSTAAAARTADVPDVPPTVPALGEDEDTRQSLSMPAAPRSEGAPEPHEADSRDGDEAFAALGALTSGTPSSTAIPVFGAGLPRPEPGESPADRGETALAPVSPAEQDVPPSQRGDQGPVSKSDPPDSTRRPRGQFSEIEGVPVVGALELAPYLATRLGIGYAIIAMPGVSSRRLLDLTERFGGAFSHVLIIPDLFGFASLGVPAKDVAGVLGLEVRQQLLLPGPRLAKRLMDVTATLLGGLFVLPILLLLAILIKVDSEGSVFYRQERLGKDGNRFRALKFRTMHGDGEKRLKEVLASNPKLRAEYEEFHKLAFDPRVTRVGRFLRKYSLDELPQLWNVLRGDMSLVGPRPYLEREVPEMDHQEGLILRALPGMTGMWQVSDRNATGFAERVKMDVHYVRNWSPWLDIYILARTIGVVIRGTGS